MKKKTQEIYYFLYVFLSACASVACVVIFRLLLSYSKDQLHRDIEKKASSKTVTQR